MRMFEVKLRAQLTLANDQLQASKAPELNVEESVAQIMPACAKVAAFVKDTVTLLHEATVSGKSILFEGAQGVMLDVDFGTYPFVTSSNTGVGGVVSGSGISHRHLGEVIGIVKAYSTRVGSGPFPVELKDKVGDELRRRGNEYGATTGRPRRCGWFDAVACRYAVMLNGVDTLAVTKLDVLDDLETLQICTGYQLDGTLIRDMPADADDLARVQPVYEPHPGWQTRTCDVRCWDDLPENAQTYLSRLAGLIGARVGIVSTGPARAETFYVNK
jgi:adenylosuccinate synthase